MTTKQINKIKSEAFKICIESMPKDERERFNITGIALLWEITEKNLTARIWTNYKEQMNANLLEFLGFTKKAKVKLLIKLNRKTKCADIFKLI